MGSAEYLRFLASNDYPLSPVEEILTGAKESEEVYSQYLADAAKQ